MIFIEIKGVYLSYMAYAFSLKKYNWRKVVKMLEVYKQNVRFQTFNGFLVSIGIGALEFQQLKMFVANENEDAIRVMRVLDNYKRELEVKMEEYLLYQHNHPDLKDLKFYNFDNVKFLLKASNPERYGDKKININTTNERSKSNEIRKLLGDNKSELK